MKKLFLSILPLFFFPVLVNAQSMQTPAGSTGKTFFQVRDDFAKKFEKEKISAVNNVQKDDNLYAKFRRWEWYWEPRAGRSGLFPKSSVIHDEWRKYAASHSLSMAKTNSLTGNWTDLGPKSSPGANEGLGRINCMAFYPASTDTFWVGTPAGGLWKTSDGGVSWTTGTDNLPVLGVSDIAINPNDPDTMYIATGDGDLGSLSAFTGTPGGDTKSIGILISVNGGLTWDTTGMNWNVMSQKHIRRLLIDPANPDILLAATSDGIYKTIDAGQTWTSTVSGYFMDMDFKPGNSSTVYASSYDDTNGNAQIFVSNDNGDSWGVVSSFTGINRIKLAVSPADPTYVGALCSDASNNGLYGIYFSANSGASFSLLYSPSINLLDWSYDGSAAGGQGEYDLCYAISPLDINEQYVGGVNNWKTTDGGSTWNLISMWTGWPGQNPNGVPVVHADKHFFAYCPSNASLFYECNDGGIYNTADGGLTWNDLTNGMEISQFYKISVSATNSTLNIGGLQDNGSKKLDGGSWSFATGGDGTDCIIDYTDPNVMYAGYVNGVIYRSTDAFVNYLNQTTISDNIPGQPSGSWITPVAINPTNPYSLYAGYQDVYKTEDRGDSWTQLSSNLTAGYDLKFLAVAPSDTQTIYSGTHYYLYVTNDQGNNWTDITPVTPATISGIAISSSDPNTAWVTLSGYDAGEKVYKTSNGGGSWMNISGTLPNLPVNCIVYQAGSNDGLYIGTDVGVFYRDGSMTDWQTFSGGLPNVVVTDLEIQYSSNKIRAGTFGRGLWESEVYGTFTGTEVNRKPNPSFSISRNLTHGTVTIITQTGTSADKAFLFSYLGQTVKVFSLKEEKQELDIHDLPAGIYYIGLKSEHFKHMEKMVKL